MNNTGSALRSPPLYKVPAVLRYLDRLNNMPAGPPGLPPQIPSVQEMYVRRLLCKILSSRRPQLRAIPHWHLPEHPSLWRTLFVVSDKYDLLTFLQVVLVQVISFSYRSTRLDHWHRPRCSPTFKPLRSELLDVHSECSLIFFRDPLWMKLFVSFDLHRRSYHPYPYSRSYTSLSLSLPTPALT